MNESKKPILYSIVIPVYNSAESLSELSERLIKTMDDINKSYEIIFIDDSSRDNSWKVLNEIQKKFSKNTRIFQLSKNFGQDNAVMAGFSFSRGEFIITMDDDLQHAPEDIPVLIEKIQKSQKDIIIGNFKNKQHSFFKRIFSRWNDKMENIMLKKKKDVYFSSFRIIRRNIIEEILKYEGPYPFIDGLIIRTTDSYDNVYISHSKRKYGRSNYNMKKLVSFWLNSFTNFSIVPLRIATILGSIFSLISFLIIVYFIILKMVRPHYLLQGWLSTIVLIVFIGGFQLLSIGLIGEYIGRIFLNINKSPQFIVRKKKDN